MTGQNVCTMFVNDKPVFEDSLQSILAGCVLLEKHCKKLLDAENPSRNAIQETQNGLQEIDESVWLLISTLDEWHGSVE